MLEVIGKNAVRLQVPPNMTSQQVVHEEHTTRVFYQPSDISKPATQRPAPIPRPDGSCLIYVDWILRHRKLGKGFQWLTAKTGTPLHEADWQPTRDFVDSDGTINENFHRYICAHNLLPHLHQIVVVDNRERSQ